MKKPTLMFLKASDLVEMYGHSFDCSAKGWAAHLDGETVAVIGIAYTKPPQCFSFIKEGIARRFPRVVVGAMKLMRDLLNDLDVPIYATPDNDEPAADSFLRHLGFQQIDKEVYQWPRQ